MYDWHVDRSTAAPAGQEDRVLSGSVQLSDPSQYKGGMLQVGATNASTARGALLVFPSHAAHKVHPVRSGIRHSLVVWQRGTPNAAFEGDAADGHQAAINALAAAEGTPAYLHVLAGESLQKTQRLHEAMEETQRAIDGDQEGFYPRARFNMGVYTGNLGRNEEAAAFFEAASKLKYGYTKALTNLAVVQAHLGRVAEAVANAGAALAAAKQQASSPSQLARIEFIRAEGLQSLRRVEEAEASYAAVLRLDPTHSGAQGKLESVPLR